MQGEAAAHVPNVFEHTARPLVGGRVFAAREPYAIDSFASSAQREGADDVDRHIVR